MKAARTRNWTYKTPTILARKRPTTAWSPTSSGASPTPRTGFSREDGCANKVVTDLPASRDIAGAQLHLNKGALRELHWHRVVSFAAQGCDT